jgi:hypothetical protein
VAVVCYLATQSHARIKAPQGAGFSHSFLAFSYILKQRENEEKTRRKRGENEGMRRFFCF